MTSTEIRHKFLKFFKEKEHSIVPSSPMVNHNDPTLMFINAGMNQFKDYFLGNAVPPNVRIADTQKCLRVSGKHNDLEEVGRDSYHQTMFEMLGNWSFGDYFKEEAIAWAWEFLVDVLGLSPDRIYVTVFEGDKVDQLKRDDPSANIWEKFVSKENILFFDKKDNFWEMGETGPCGPCSEIHYDLRKEDERRSIPGASLVNADHPQLVEIWNLVFIQYNRKADRSLTELPQKHVDTGMGFERLVMAVQGVLSNYDTDIFKDAIQYVENRAKVQYEGKYVEDAKIDITLRVIADHSRAVAFAIADGAIPSNTGPGYVIRRILRRAIRYYYTYLNISEPMVYELVVLWAEYYKDIFPELALQSAFIQKLIKQEELSFLKTIEAGLRKLDNLKIRDGVISGEDAFELYDTYGFPIDLTRLIASEKGQEVNDEEFDAALRAQRDRSRADGKREVSDWIHVADESDVLFVGYDLLSLDDANILKYRKSTNKSKEECHLVIDKTPFYPEGGGQIGDRGYLSIGDEKIRVLDTFKENNLIIHSIDKIPAMIGAPVNAFVDKNKRASTERNHSATHLLHAALRKVLGKHVEQRGSLVNDKHLRFDFSHFQQVTPEEIRQVEDLVNDSIRSNISKLEQREVPIKKAKEAGAMMLFGEKYSDHVRMITFNEDFSVELCGGCHVERTGDIGWFKVTVETAVAAGIHRIEAVTGIAAEKFIVDRLAILDTISTTLKNPKDLPSQLDKVIQENKYLSKQIEKMNKETASSLKTPLLLNAKVANGISFIVADVGIDDAAIVKTLAFDLVKQLGKSIVLLGSKNESKAMLTLALDRVIVESHLLDASKLIKPIAKLIQGGGGGQNFFATAGGSDPSQLEAALKFASELFLKTLEEVTQ